MYRTAGYRTVNYKSYKVKYSLRGSPHRNAETIINAPNMQYIRDNWNAICGGKPFVIQKITSVA